MLECPLCPTGCPVQVSIRLPAGGGVGTSPEDYPDMPHGAVLGARAHCGRRVARLDDSPICCDYDPVRLIRSDQPGFGSRPTVTATSSLGAAVAADPDTALVEVAMVIELLCPGREQLKQPPTASQVAVISRPSRCGPKVDSADLRIEQRI